MYNRWTNKSPGIVGWIIIELYITLMICTVIDVDSSTLFGLPMTAAILLPSVAIAGIYFYNRSTHKEEVTLLEDGIMAPILDANMKVVSTFIPYDRIWLIRLIRTGGWFGPRSVTIELSYRIPEQRTFAAVSQFTLEEMEGEMAGLQHLIEQTGADVRYYGGGIADMRFDEILVVDEHDHSHQIEPSKKT